MQNMGMGRRNFLMRITTTKKTKKNKKCIKNMQKVFTFPMMCTIATYLPILMFPPSSINCPILPNNQVIHLICKDSRYHFQITAVSDHNLPSVRKGLNTIFGYNKEIT
jgi:hypothetical protein